MRSDSFGRNGVSKSGAPSDSQQTPSAWSLLLHPGIGIKRWALITGIGLLFVALGVAFLLPVPISPGLLAVARQVTLNWLPPLARGLAFLALGALLLLVSGRRLHRLVTEGMLGGRETKHLLQDLHQYRTRIRGPRVVAIGGGTGLSTLLRGLKYYTRNITAVVTVADDGGSSGRLREELAIPPPGDARNCLIALSDVEPLMENLMQYRFGNGNGLTGHSLGNLLLAALTDMEGGFSQGLESAAQLLRVNGRVLPATLATDVVLVGVTEDGQRVQGESNIGAAGSPLKRVWLEPEGLPANPEVAKAIRETDIVVIAPGSLYTSIIPAVLVDGVRQALQESRVPMVFVCNVATQSGETDGYGVAEHIQAFREHTGIEITHVIANTNVEALPEGWGQVAVEAKRPAEFMGRFVAEDVVDGAQRTRHDPAKLAKVVMNIAGRA